MPTSELEILSFARTGQVALRPSWMASSCDFKSLTWEFAEPAQSPIRFNVPLPDGSFFGDTQHLGALDTIRWILLLTRRGADFSDSHRLTVCNTDSATRRNAGYLLNTYRYINLHGLSGFSAVSPERLEDYLEKATWGAAALLEVGSRLRKYVEGNNNKLPVKVESERRMFLDYRSVAQSLGVSTKLLAQDVEALQLLKTAAQDQGLYIPPTLKLARKRTQKAVPDSASSLSHFIGLTRGAYTITYFGISSKSDSVDLLRFYPWPGHKTLSLAKSRTAVAMKSVPSEVKKLAQQNSRTASLTIQSGLNLVERSIRFLTKYGDYLLDLRDRVYPELYREALARSNGGEAGRTYARQQALESINRNHPPKQIDDPLCPWPFNSVVQRTRNHTHGVVHHFTLEDLAPLIEEVEAGVLTWSQAAHRLGLKRSHALRRIWKRLNDPLRLSNRLEQPSLMEAVDWYLPAAAYICLAVFSARREMELLKLRADCLSSDGEQYIEMYSAKYFREWDLFPCVPVMARAVKLLDQWSAPARAMSGDTRLFQVYHSFYETPDVGKFYTQRSMRFFANYLGVPLVSIYGEPVTLSDHQFRRLFSNIFLNRYFVAAHGKLEALSHQLRHRDPAVTEVYVREAVSGQVYDEVQLEISAATATAVMLGTKPAVGHLASHLTEVSSRLRGRYLATIQIATESEARNSYDLWLRDTMHQHVIKTQMAVSTFAFGHCYGRALPLRRFALCNSESDRNALAEPNFENANFALCKNCPCFMALDEHLPCIQSYVELSESVAASKDQPEPLRATCAGLLEQMAVADSRLNVLRSS